jgi:hypothetical protein
MIRNLKRSMVNIPLKRRISYWFKGDKGNKHTTIERSESRTSLPYGSSQKSIPPPTSPIQGCVVDITREVGSLRSDLAHFQALSHEALMPLLPVIESHCSGLSLAIQQCNQIIEQANACRQLQKNSITSIS